MRLDASGGFFTREREIVKASYVEAFENAKQKKLLSIGETLIKPCVPKMAG